MQMEQASGLSDAEVEQSRQKNGANELTAGERQTFLRQFLASFGDPIIKILLAALAVNVILLFREANWFESVGIALAIFLATFVSTLSEYGSESAFLKLQAEAAAAKCRVRRNGKLCELPVSELVVGDIVLLQAGEAVPADGVLLSGRLSADQSALNGESTEQRKTPGGASGDFLSPSGLFRGAVVTSGEGVMRVSAVGDKTFYGSMAREMQEGTRESPLKLRLEKLAGVLSKIGLAAGLFVAGADLFNSFVLSCGMDPTLIAQQFQNPAAVFGHVLHAATLAITVVVVAVPEGLPMMITVVLSSNMQRMLRDHVLVRKLVGIETSGSLNILFTDKTGTLTQGRLKAVSFACGSGLRFRSLDQLKRRRALWERFQLCSVYNNASELSGGRAIGGNATDRALLEAACPAPGTAGGQKTVTVPFDSARKFAAVRAGGMTFVKGAPEKILRACTHYLDEQGERRPLYAQTPVTAEWEDMARHAMRVLALAQTEEPVNSEGGLRGLTLIGLVGIRDDLRREVPAAVRTAQQAGVQIVMITGDNKETAAAIAGDAGLLDRADSLILTSAELQKMSDSELIERLPALRVVARALPTDKSRLVRAAQQRGLVAGMTGDGINDAPALKKADVGFAMGSGTEVAKEAGDIVILDDNFSSITRAILYGRTIFKSIRKFVIFQLTMNLCAVGVSIIGPFLQIDTPVTVIQMLWINIIMDTLAGLAFAGEAPLPEYMLERPKRRDEPVLNRYMLHQIACMGVYTIVLCLAFLKLPFFQGLYHQSENPIYLQTGFFTLFILCGVCNSFNTRTYRVNLLANLRKNPLFAGIMAAVVLIQIGMVYWGGTMFRTAPLTLGELGAVALLSVTVIPADLLRKLALRRKGIRGSI
ncbi:calcium-translocating P-type ATPase, PMCA-type [Agathobaculum sp.]|uniref:calcium-translocating P-type ATPase, PMCA-type n=1 Tax=Agathobaculum sp. TaxID=2048138 RepID=UPI002A80667C|nr:calcium-translocating P-type ATPase, PMCA-type [Agathobaculum sp.]MDY3619142.1 calcium-translocating P-type ATPase, PMCA-type [Agathobaculum sp.]